MLRKVATTALGLLCLSMQHGMAAELSFTPDSDPNRIEWSQLERKLGPVSDVAGRSYGIVVKTPVNEYWRLMTAGYRARAAADGVSVDIQAAQTESDIERQLAIMHNMLGNGYDAIMISPISTQNLQPAVEDALSYSIPLIDVDGAAVDNVPHFVGPVNVEMGRLAAQWFIHNVPAGGEVAIIEGKSEVLSTVQRSSGFRDALKAAKFPVVATVAGDWDTRMAYAAAEKILTEHPGVIGIYCNNDTMALAAVDAIRKAGALDRVAIIGSDGTRAAYDSIRKGELKGTVDIFPWMIGWIGLEVAERVVLGQAVPRVIETPQILVTLKNLTTFDVPTRELKSAITKIERAPL